MPVSGYLGLFERPRFGLMHFAEQTACRARCHRQRLRPELGDDGRVNPLQEAED